MGNRSVFICTASLKVQKGTREWDKLIELADTVKTEMMKIPSEWIASSSSQHPIQSLAQKNHLQRSSVCVVNKLNSNSAQSIPEKKKKKKETLSKVKILLLRIPGIHSGIVWDRASAEQQRRKIHCFAVIDRKSCAFICQTQLNCR